MKTGRTCHWQGIGLAASVILALMLSASSAIAQNASEPVAGMDGDNLHIETYGDATNVQLLSDLARDEDPLVRHRAALDLGQTHNPQALPRVKTMLGDADTDVRCAALSALGELDANQAVAAAIDAASSKDQALVRSAIMLIRQRRFTDALRAVRPLALSPDAAVAAAAIETLTEFQATVHADQLPQLLTARSVAVKLAALDNLLLWSASGDTPKQTTPATAGRLGGGTVLRVHIDKTLEAELVRMAAQEAPAVRAAALAALGKPAFVGAAGPLAEAERSEDPMLRRGALWCYRYAGQGEKIPAFLDDVSPMVRLAAVRAAGALKCQPATARLVELMLQAPDEQMSFAAAEALGQIGGQEAADRVAAALAELASPEQLERLAPNPEAAAKAPAKARPQAKTAPKSRPAGGDVVATSGPSETPAAPVQLSIVERNVVACCRAMGAMTSPAAIKSQAAIMARLSVLNPVVIEVAASLGRIGDAAAVGPLVDKLKACHANGMAWLNATAEGAQVIPPYEPAVTVAVVEALGELKAQAAVEMMLRLATAGAGKLRLDAAAAAAARAIPSIAVPSELRSGVEKAIISMLADQGFAPLPRFEAAKAAGKLKLTSAVDSLQKLLAARDSRQVMNAAAWAIGQITGNTPAIGEPKRNQGDWIVTVVEQQ